MRVLISTDIEGVAGIYHRVHTTRANPNTSARGTAFGADVNVAEQPGWAGISPFAFPGPFFEVDAPLSAIIGRCGSPA